MDGVQRGYDNLTNCIIEIAYYDLVDAMIKAVETRRRMDRAKSTELRAYWERQLKQDQKEVSNLSEWMIIVIPRWRDLDGKRFIKWASEEVEIYAKTGHRRSGRLDPTI